MSRANELIYALHGMDPAAPPCEPRCSEEYCAGCAAAECPHGEPLHRHHDGCPACEAPKGDPVASWPLCAVCGKGAREGKHATDLGEGHDYVPTEVPGGPS